MARTPEFDRTEVVEAALKVFWSDGYEASSIQKLLAAMNLNRGSLYGSFGDKSRLFCEVMDHYVAIAGGIIEDALLAIEDPLDAIQSFFYRALLLSDEKTRSYGCLLLNTVSELNQTAPNLAQEALRRVAPLIDAFEHRVAQAQTLGLIGDEKSARALAHYLMALLAGVRLQAKMGASRETIKDIIDTGLVSLKPCPR